MTDSDADAISERIQKSHLLYGFIAETRFMSSTSDEISWTTGNGDGAIWTGAYLAAEAFRYAATESETARTYLNAALERVRDLSCVAPTGFIARTIFPADLPDAAPRSRFLEAEKTKGLFPFDYRGRPSWWEGWPTRDQYAGVFLGLSVAHDLVDDADIRQTCRETITHLTDSLIAHQWTTRNPVDLRDYEGNHVAAHFETFLTYPHHMLSVLQLARHVDADRFGSRYRRARPVLSRLARAPLQYDICSLRKHYYLLNLDHVYYYNLIRYEDVPKYRKRYLKQFAVLRKATRGHGNAYFNMIDCALNGLDAGRDAETVRLLEQLLERGFRDDPIDLNGQYPACAPDDACDPIPVYKAPNEKRPYEDFLWQRSPFAMICKGDGSLESPGIDYILPYWMARYYKVV